MRCKTNNMAPKSIRNPGKVGAGEWAQWHGAAVTLLVRCRRSYAIKVVRKSSVRPSVFLATTATVIDYKLVKPTARSPYSLCATHTMALFFCYTDLPLSNLPVQLSTQRFAYMRLHTANIKAYL